MAFYTYSHETYEPCTFGNGTFHGTPEEGFEVGAVYLRARCFSENSSSPTRLRYSISYISGRSPVFCERSPLPLWNLPINGFNASFLHFLPTISPCSDGDPHSLIIPHPIQAPQHFRRGAGRLRSGVRHRVGCGRRSPGGGVCRRGFRRRRDRCRERRTVRSPYRP